MRLPAAALLVLVAQVRMGVVGPPSGATVVSNTSELAQALIIGGAIQLQPGTYAGNFVIDVDGTSLSGVTLPVARVASGATAAVMLTPADALRPALQIIGNASHIRVTGLTVQATRTDRPPIIVGSPTALTPELQPDDITFDRVEILAAAAGGKRGLEAHARRFALLRSRVTGFLLSGQDSQAFWACNGPGPYSIEDNQLEASGENVLFGGSAIKGPAMVPGGIIVRNNDIVKPAAWRSVAGSVKNSVECKACNGALIEGNRIDGCWPDAQPGHMIVLTPRNQGGTAPDAVVQDVIIRGNRSINHTGGYAVNVLYTDNAYPSKPTARITIEGNLFQDSKSGFQLLGGVDDYLRITDNTLPGVTSVLGTFESMTGKTVNLTYERNVSLSGAYGWRSPTTVPGKPTLDIYSTGTFAGNVIEKTPARAIAWPAGNTILAVGGLAPLLDADFHYLPGGAGW